MVHMLKACPSILARKCLYAREHLLIPAFEKYFADNSHLQGSVLVQCRYIRTPGTKRTNPVAFRSFGGGSVLCPGRHFVSTEVMSFVALLLLRFDVKPLSKGGKWTEPSKRIPMTSAIPTPKTNLQVQLVPRDNRRWHVNFSSSSKGVNMVAEDAL
jgi:hypothetical protein